MSISTCCICHEPFFPITEDLNSELYPVHLHTSLHTNLQITACKAHRTCSALFFSTRIQHNISFNSHIIPFPCPQCNVNITFEEASLASGKNILLMIDTAIATLPASNSPRLPKKPSGEFPKKPPTNCCIVL